MNEITITVEDLQIPVFRSKIFLQDPKTDEGLLRPLVIESFEDEFKVCDMMSSSTGVIVFSIETLTELDDVVDNCVTIEEAQKAVQFWQDTTADHEVAYIHLVNKTAFDAIIEVAQAAVFKTFSSN